MLDSNAFLPDDDFEKLPETYVFFTSQRITEIKDCRYTTSTVISKK